MCVVRLHAKAGSENWIIGMAPASFSMEKIDDRSTTLRSFFKWKKLMLAPLRYAHFFSRKN